MPQGKQKKNDNKKKRSVNSVKKKTCFCCGGDHYLSQCRSTKLTEEWKKNNKDSWSKFGTWKGTRVNNVQNTKSEKKHKKLNRRRSYQPSELRKEIKIRTGHTRTLSVVKIRARIEVYRINSTSEH